MIVHFNSASTGESIGLNALHIVRVTPGSAKSDGTPVTGIWIRGGEGRIGVLGTFDEVTTKIDESMFTMGYMWTSGANGYERGR